MNTQLSEEQISELKKAFALFDKDGDGFLSKQDLVCVLKSLGEDPTEEEIQSVFDEVNGNKSEQIDLDEFIRMMCQGAKVGEMDGDHSIETFKWFDRDGNGYISADELKHAMTTLGESPTDEEISAMIKEADTDGDGKVNYEEFLKVMDWS